jgi:hypothetical protein
MSAGAGPRAKAGTSTPWSWLTLRGLRWGQAIENCPSVRRCQAAWQQFYISLCLTLTKQSLYRKSSSAQTAKHLHRGI